MSRPATSPSVALWIVDLDRSGAAGRYDPTTVAAPWSWLDDAERAGVDAARAADDRARRAASHVALRSVLGAWLQQAPEAVGLGRAPCPLCSEPHGRPVVIDRHERSFSLSRAGGVAAVACSADGTVGVDIETSPARVGADDLAAARTTIEEAELQALPPDQRDAAALRAWTRKEALLKGWGTGLGVDPAAVGAGLGWAPERSPAITSAIPTVELPDDGIVEAQWTVTDVAVAMAVVVAVAFRPDPARTDLGPTPAIACTEVTLAELLDAR